MAAIASGVTDPSPPTPPGRAPAGPLSPIPPMTGPIFWASDIILVMSSALILLIMSVAALIMSGVIPPARSLEGVAPEVPGGEEEGRMGSPPSPAARAAAISPLPQPGVLPAAADGAEDAEDGFAVAADAGAGGGIRPAMAIIEDISSGDILATISDALQGSFGRGMGADRGRRRKAPRRKDAY